MFPPASPKVEAVKKFFRDAVEEAGLLSAREKTKQEKVSIDFEILSGVYEAELEWLAVKTACTEVLVHSMLYLSACVFLILSTSIGVWCQAW